jgi:polyphosphate kinase 2 (PPK2 family)
MSKGEQKKRLLSRIDDPEKYWKVSAGDIAERELWNDYMEAYEDCLAATSTRNAPWYVVPADDKKTARLIVSRAILDAMRALPMSFPKPDAGMRKELQAMRRALMNS